MQDIDKVQESVSKNLETDKFETADTFSIYQLKDDSSTRDLRWEPLKIGMLPDAKNYNFVYMSTMLKGCTLDEIYNLFHSSNAPDIKGHALGVSDIVVTKVNGELSAHYVDRFGFKEVNSFLQSLKEKSAIEELRNSDKDGDGLPDYIDDTYNPPERYETEKFGYKEITSKQFETLSKSDIEFESKKSDNGFIIKFDKADEAAISAITKPSNNLKL